MDDGSRAFPIEILKTSAGSRLALLSISLLSISWKWIRAGATRMPMIMDADGMQARLAGAPPVLAPDIGAAVKFSRCRRR
jgi:hypothetical protein